MDQTSLLDLIKDDYQNQLDALNVRKKGGDLTEDEYLTQAKELADRRKNDLGVVKKENFRLLADNPDPAFVALKDQYTNKDQKTPFFDKAVSIVDQSLPQFNEAINFLDGKVAEQLGTTIEEAKIQTRLWEQGRGGLPVDAEKARGKAVEDFQEELMAKYPNLPTSLFETYISSSADFTEQDFGDLGNRKNPYSGVKQKFADAIIEKNFPNIDRDEKQQLRREIISYSANKAAFQRANDKAIKALNDAEIQAPDEMLKIFEEKSDQFSDMYGKEIVAIDQKMSLLAEKTKSDYELQDEKFTAAGKARLDTLRTDLESNVRGGMIEQEEAEEYYALQVQEFNRNRKALFNDHSERLARQQRQLLNQANEIKEDHFKRLQSLAAESGLDIKDGQIQVNEDYLNKYNALLKQYIAEEAESEIRTVDGEYRNLPIEEKLANAWTLGYMDMFEGVGGGMKWLGWFEAGNFLTDLSENANLNIPTPAFKEFTWSEVTNPDWWVNRGVRSLPIMMQLGLTGGGVTSLTAGSLAGTTLSTTAQALIAGSAGAAAMRPMEAFIEAGSTYEHHLKNGEDVNQAGQAAADVFKKNMNLFFLDAMQLGITFGNFPGKLITSPGGKLSASLSRVGNSMLGKGIINFATEGLEEVYQEWAQAKTENPLLTLWQFAQTPQGQEAFALGGMMGVGFSVMGGTEQGQITQVNKMIREYMKHSKRNQDGLALKRRQMHLGNTLDLLKERGVITEGEFNNAVGVLENSFAAFEKSLDGSIPIDWNSDAHTEYTILARQHRKISQEVEQDKNGPDVAVKKAQQKAISTRMTELVMDPGAAIYSIDGIPFSREDFESIVGITPLSNMIADENINIQNDADMMANQLMSADPTKDNSRMVEEYINQAEDFADLPGAIDDAAAKVEAAKKDGNTEHMAGFVRLEEVLKSAQDRANANNLLEKYHDGSLVNHLNSLGTEEAAIEFESSIAAMDQTGVPAEDIQAFKEQLPELSMNYDSRDSDQTIDPPSEFVDSDVTGAKVGSQLMNINQEYFEASLDPEVQGRIREENPELSAQIEQYDDINDIPNELKQEYVNLAKQDPAQQEEAKQDQEPTIEDPSSPTEENELEEEQVAALSRKEEKAIDRRIAQLKSDLKGWFDEQKVLRLTPFDEDALMKDLEAAAKAAELAYLSIKKGIRTATEWANQLGVAVTEELRQAWNMGLKQYRAERDQRIRLDSELTRVDAFIEFFQDKDVAINRMIKQLNQQGIDINDDTQLYVKRELMTSRASYKIGKFIEGFVGRDTSKLGSGTVNKESFFGRLEEAGIQPDDLSLYMYAKHAPQYNARVHEMSEKKQEKEVNRLQLKKDAVKTKKAKDRIQGQIDDILLNYNPEFEVIENGSGMTDEMASDIISHYEGQDDSATLMEFAEEFRNEVVIGRINMLEEAGMLDADSADALRNGTSEDSNIKFDFYIPLKVKRSAFVEMNDPAFTSGGSRPGSIRRIKGSGKYNFLDRNNPMHQAMIDYAATIQHIELNETNKSFYRLIENNPENALWEIVPSRAIVKYDEDGTVSQTQDLVSGDIKENSIVVVIDGKIKYIYMKPVYDKKGNVVPHPVMKALKRSSASQHRAVKYLFDWSRFLINIKRNLVTTYNIAFGVPNAFRDVQEAMANITTDKEATGIKHVRRRIMANMLPAYKAIAQSPWAQGGNPMSDALFEAKENGMDMSWFRYEGSEEQIENYTKMINDYHKHRGRKAYPVEAWNSMANFFMYVNDIFENGTRLAVYKAVRDAGVSAQEAASIAKNITLNFEKKGIATGTINAFYLFANAGIQGVARGGKLLFSPNGRKILGVVAVTSFLNQMLLDLSDEEDKLDVYGSFDRDNNFFLYNPWEPDEPFRVPKPYSFVRFAANLGESTYDVVAGKTSAINSVARVLRSLQTVTDPVGGAQDNIVSAYTPTMFRVPVEWFMNKKWNNSPFYFYGDDKKGSELKTAKTAPWAIAISDFLDESTDFFKTDEGLISISPALIEYGVKDFFGGVGTELTNLYDISTEGFTINKFPIARRFYVDLDSKQETYMYRLYEMMKRPNKDGITESEIQIARKAYDVIRKNQLSDPRTIGRIKSSFEKKYKVKLE